MKKIFAVAALLLVLTGCGSKKTNTTNENKEVIDNTNVNIAEMPDVRGNENVKVDDKGTKTNISSDFAKQKEYGKYLITNAAIKTDSEGRTTFTAIVTNNSQEEVQGGLVDIIFVDSKGNKVSKLPTYIRTLAAGEAMDVNANIDKDLSNAYNFSFAAHEN